jgi:hypothetical protein
VESPEFVIQPVYWMLSGGLDTPQPPIAFAEALVVGGRDRPETGKRDKAGGMNLKARRLVDNYEYSKHVNWF